MTEDSNGINGQIGFKKGGGGKVNWFEFLERSREGNKVNEPNGISTVEKTDYKK